MPSSTTTLLLAFALLAPLGDALFRTFGNDNSFNYTGMLNSDEQLVFNLTLLPSQEFMFVRVNATTFEGYTMLLVLSDHNVKEWYGTAHDKENWEYLWLQPSVTGKACPGAFTAAEKPCTFTLTVTASWPQSTVIRLEGYRGDMLPFGQTTTGELQRSKSRFYAAEIDDEDLNVHVSMQPNKQLVNMDLDIFCTASTHPEKPFFPSSSQKNHYFNAEEAFIISPQFGYAGPALYVVEVLASPDSHFEQNSFTLTFTRRYTDDVSFGLSLLGIVGALTVLLLCLFFAGAILYRRQRLIQLEAIMAANALNALTGDAPVAPGRPPGASTTQLAALRITKFTVGDMPEEDAKCTICLTEYETGTFLRWLPCGHHFDQGCADSWLRQKRWCPLCLQDIEKGHDVTRKASVTALPPAAATPAQRAREEANANQRAARQADEAGGIEMAVLPSVVIHMDHDHALAELDSPESLRSPNSVVSEPLVQRDTAAHTAREAPAPRQPPALPERPGQYHGTSREADLASLVRDAEPPSSPSIVRVQLPGSGEPADYTIRVDGLNGASSALTDSAIAPASFASASSSSSSSSSHPPS